MGARQSTRSSYSNVCSSMFVMIVAGRAGSIASCRWPGDRGEMGVRWGGETGHSFNLLAKSVPINSQSVLYVVQLLPALVKIHTSVIYPCAQRRSASCPACFRHASWIFGANSFRILDKTMLNTTRNKHGDWSQRKAGPDWPVSIRGLLWASSAREIQLRYTQTITVTFLLL